MNPILYIDIDGVMADSIPWWLALYNKQNHTRYTKEDIKKWGDADLLVPFFQNYDYVLPVPGAFEALGKLCQKFTVKFASSGYGIPWMEDQLSFEAENFEFIQIKSKWLLRGFALVDDNTETVLKFIDNNQGKYNRGGYVLKQPWNRGLTWEQITEYLLDEREQSPT